MRGWLCTAALLGALGVILGAFGAHGLAARLDAHALATFETGARYHMLHALAMAVAALAMRGPARPRARAAAMLLGVGILLFSGSLYGLALTGVRALGAVTPIGGLLMLAGWAALIWTALKRPPAT